MLEKLKNLYRTENTLSGAWFCEHLSDWSKTVFGSPDLASGRKVEKLPKQLHIHSDNN